MNKILKMNAYKRRYGKAAEFILKWREKGKHGHTPWARTASNIRWRCKDLRVNNFEYYGGKGIKCLIKSSDLKISFMRDRAYNMKNPSIDRIDPDGNYTPENTRWIEFSRNRVEKGLNHPKRKKQHRIMHRLILDKAKSFKWSLGMLRHSLNASTKELREDRKKILKINSSREKFF